MRMLHQQEAKQRKKSGRSTAVNRTYTPHSSIDPQLGFGCGAPRKKTNKHVLHYGD